MAHVQAPRIVAGEQKGLRLTMPKGVRLRPTSAKVREAVFNILSGRVEGARVADLYAGTGALGLEALSQGAAEATFMERTGGGCKAILDSAARAGYAGRVTVLRGVLPAGAETLKGPFDLIFADPPYDAEDAEETLGMLVDLLADGGQVVYEHRSRYNPAERPRGLQLDDHRIYGDSAIAFYSAEEGE